MLQPTKFGKYLLLERIAVGGMAEVFVAKAFGVEGFERLLAIKKILPTMGEDQEFITMFVDEARIAVQLAHANIVQVLELGKVDDNLFIAMEYISGRDVRQLLERFRKKGEPMPIPQACTIVGKVCEALDYAHRKRDARGMALGIVHRDVSPQNVLVSFEGDTKLIDFGIAKAESRLQRTQAGILKGKFSYMSPEQVRGLPIDHRSDVFAVGVLLWELLCGEKLFTGDSDFAVLEKVRNGAVPSPRSKNPRIPEALEKVALKALAAEVADRYQWASELHDALMRFTLIGDIVYGARQLSEWMREEFYVEHAKEQERLRRWLGIADQDVEVTPSDPLRRKPLPPSRPPSHSSQQSLGGAVELTPQARGQPRPDYRSPDSEPPLVQPPTPTGVRGRSPPSQRATPAPGELKPPVLPRPTPERIPQPQQRASQPPPPPPVSQPPDLSPEAPTQKMDESMLVAAEKALFARRAAAAAMKNNASLGDAEDESTINEAGSLPRGDPAMAPTMPAGYRVERYDLPSSPAAARPPPPPPDITPTGGPGAPQAFGADEKTPGPDLGPHDSTPAYPVTSVPAVSGAEKPITLRERPLAGGQALAQTQTPTPVAPAPLPARPRGNSGAPVAVSQVRGAALAVTAEVDLRALANEQTQPMPVQPSAFDVSDGDTAAPRSMRKAGLSRPIREQQRVPEPPKKSRRGLLVFALLLVVTAGLAVALWPSSEAPPGRMVLTVNPSVPAELLLDGKAAGPLPPFVRTVAAGSHKVEIRAGGFKPFTATIHVVGGGRPIELIAELQPEGPMQVEGVVLAPPGEQGEVVPSKPTRPRWLTGPGSSGSGASGASGEKQQARPDPAPDKGVDKSAYRTPDKAADKGVVADRNKPAPGASGAKAALPPPPAEPAPAPSAPALSPPPAALASPSAPAPSAAPAPAPAVAEPGRRPVDPGKKVASFDPMSDPARLRVTTAPPGAEIVVDDRPVGRSPVAVPDLDTSKVLIVRITLDGYKSERRVAKGEDGKFAAMNLNLIPLGIQPARVDPPPAALAQSPAAQAAAEPTLPAAPEPVEANVGFLITMTKPIAKVLIDGKDTGRWTPVAPKNPISLPPGPHTIVFETAAGKKHEAMINIEVGKTTRLIKMDLQ